MNSQQARRTQMTQSRGIKSAFGGTQGGPTTDYQLDGHQHLIYHPSNKQETED
jgi:hypothetical protein